MTAVGFGVAWLGFTVGLYGYSLVKGYDLSFGQLVHPKNYYKGSWPPPLIPDGQLWPSAAPPAKGEKTA